MSSLRALHLCVVAIGCAGLIWLSVRTSLVGALIQENPVAARTIAPDDPRAVLRLAMEEFGSRNGSVSPDLRSAAISAVTKAPLAYEPFFIAALDALIEKNGRPEQLLREATRRNPRSRASQLLLLDQQMRAGRLEDSIWTMNLLTRLIPRAASALIPELARFAAAKETRPAMKRILAKDARMRKALLEHLSAEAGDPDLVLELAGSSNGADDRGWQQALITSLVAQGNHQSAYSLWKQFSGSIKPEPGNSIYNPTFQASAGIFPFDWRYLNSNVGVAEPKPSEGLDVEYFGGEQAKLAEQLLLLAPARYRLSTRVQAADGGDGDGTLAWTIACSRSSIALLNLPITGKKASEEYSGEFSIPSGCDAQWLTLVGRPSEFRKVSYATVQNLKLKRVS
jgi:hypothetical protein